MHSDDWGAKASETFKRTAGNYALTNADTCNQYSITGSTRSRFLYRHETVSRRLRTQRTVQSSHYRRGTCCRSLTRSTRTRTKSSQWKRGCGPSIGPVSRNFAPPVGERTLVRILHQRGCSLDTVQSSHQDINWHCSITATPGGGAGRPWIEHLHRFLTTAAQSHHGTNSEIVRTPETGDAPAAFDSDRGVGRITHPAVHRVDSRAIRHRTHLRCGFLYDVPQHESHGRVLPT